MKILITGGLGFIGSNLIRNLKNHKVIVFTKQEHSLKKLPNYNNVIFEFGNIEDVIADVIVNHKPDVVIHLIVFGGITKCHEDPASAFRVNVFGAYNVINSCKKVGAKLILASSREVYGESRGEESLEEDPMIPNNVLGITKMLVEILVKIAEKDGLDYTIMRLTNVYGPGDNKSGISKIIKDIINRNPIHLYGGNQTLNFIYIDDVINIINEILTNKNSSKQVFNVGSKDNFSIERFVDILSELLAIKANIIKYPQRDGETHYFKPSIQKLDKLLGYSNFTPLYIGLKKTTDWILQNN